MSNASTPAQYALILIDMVENLGFSRDDIMRGTTLAATGLGGIGARIDDSDFRTLSGNALQLTGDTALGLKLGMRLHLSAHATLGQAFMTCRDLGQVVDLFGKYYHLLAPNLQLQFETTAGRCYIDVIDNTDQHNQVFMFEVLFGAVFNTLQSLLGVRALKIGLQTPYPAPGHSDLYHEIFGDEVEFDCPQARIALHAELLDSPLPSSNPALRTLYEEECARLLADLQESDSAAEQTLRLLRKLEGQYPQMPQLASMLNFSSRTYRRRLERENESYQTLLDRVRAEHATRYLRHSQMPLSSIAYIVGFNDASNFRRAYLKWTGHSPGAVRRGQ